MKPTDPHPDEQVFLLLSRSYALCRKMAEKELRLAGVTLSEYTLMRIVHNTPGVTAGMAAKRLDASAPSVAQLVKSLHAKGFISRGSDRADIRRQPMTLTWKGRRAVIRARAAIQKALRKMTLSEKTLHSLISDLSTLLTSLSPYGD